ncbi:uncharacterized protein B0H18DRAFT_254158 [Fomitopsis serialis]|uniref:uncharacterized protein n=1 Tax=Fomitopsis serialis TaxID=139415 RepID=UPI00200870D3|nr:uncharacterized protein B0H18DRAFT_254158 [Neoantrodia serialis]KAH9928302.1 hypothetical protein B0H18DRAFT_254158 [Neoantrodia serialis]
MFATRRPWHTTSRSLCTRSQLRRRLLSTSSPPTVYSPKVRAFPFAMPAEDVLQEANIFTAMYSWKYGSRPETRPGLFRHLWSLDLFDGNGNWQMRPKNVQAVYLPVWLIDSAVTFDAEYERPSGWRSAFVSVSSDLSYMPGFVYEPLSRMALNSPALSTSAAVPFSEDLRTQHGTQVLCLPFTHTPFPLLELCSQMENIRWPVGPTFHIKPHTASVTMMAAYPVLVPVYVLQYELNLINGPANYTVVMDAASTSGGYYINDDYFRLVAEGLTVPQVADTRLSLLLSPVGCILQFMKSFANLTCDVVSSGTRVGSAAIEKELSQLLGDAAFTKGAMEAYQKHFFSDATSFLLNPHGLWTGTICASGNSRTQRLRATRRG